MYFFQDDIGLLIQHAQNNFRQFLFLPQAEHFAPVLHALTFVEFSNFHLNFYGYFFVSITLHIINVLILFMILRTLKLPLKLAVPVSTLFFINLTFTEPLLWFSAQGVVLSNIFIALSFYFWLKKSPLIYLSIAAASLSYSTGLGLGLIFGVIDLLQGEFSPGYFLIGIASFITGPVIAGHNLGNVTPVFTNPVLNIFQFLSFVIGGVGRGVFSRLLLPGFEPRHFEIVKTVLSFIPFITIAGLVVYFQKSKGKKIKVIFITLSVLIFYPYIWAGFIRYQFGIKQALAERYAYTPLFFTVILLGVILKYYYDKKIFSSIKPLIFIVTVIIIFQSIFFYKKAHDFEKRPLLTQTYINTLKEKLKNGGIKPVDPLPWFINQPLKVRDLYTLIDIK